MIKIKNKNKIHLFVTLVLFSSVFFVKINEASAVTCASLNGTCDSTCLGTESVNSSATGCSSPEKCCVPSSSGSTGSNSTAASGTSAALDCGSGFEKIGGVCYPTDTGLSDATISSILTNLFFWLMGLFTTLAVMAFVISGIQYLTAAGSEDLMETAKRNMIYSIIGILVGLSGFVIVRAIAAALSGTTSIF